MAWKEVRFRLGKAPTEDDVHSFLDKHLRPAAYALAHLSESFSGEVVVQLSVRDAAEYDADQTKTKVA